MTPEAIAEFDQFMAQESEILDIVIAKLREDAARDGTTQAMADIGMALLMLPFEEYGFVLLMAALHRMAFGEGQ